MIKKLSIISLMIIGLGLVVGCDKSTENFVWHNDNAVYAFIKSGFENDILRDVEGSFADFDFQRVYVIEKNINDETSLSLLFVLNGSGLDKQEEFREFLNQDERIEYTRNNRDLFYETVNTRHIEKEKSIIKIGETLILEAKGSIDYYVQPFEFDGIFIKPVTNKTYTVADFPQVNLKSIEVRDNGWLYLELTKESYFETVKAANILSRLSAIDKLELDKSKLVSVIPPIWEISDTSVATIIETTFEFGRYKALIKGIKSGDITVSFDGISCEITVE